MCAEPYSHVLVADEYVILEWKERFNVQLLHCLKDVTVEYAQYLLSIAIGCRCDWSIYDAILDYTFIL